MEKNFSEIRKKYVIAVEDQFNRSKKILDELTRVKELDEFKKLLEDALNLKQEIVGLSEQLDVEHLSTAEKYLISFACRPYALSLDDFMSAIPWKEVLEKSFKEKE